MDFREAAKKHRLQAEEARAKAGLMRDGTTREQYLKIAETYDRLAANEELMANNRPPKQ